MCFILRWQHNSKLIYIIFESRREKKIIVDGKLYNYHYVWVIIVEMLMLMITQIATNGQKKVLRKNYHTQQKSNVLTNFCSQLQTDKKKCLERIITQSRNPMRKQTLVHFDWKLIKFFKKRAIVNMAYNTIPTG